MTNDELEDEIDRLYNLVSHMESVAIVLRNIAPKEYQTALHDIEGSCAGLRLHWMSDERTD